MSCSERLCSGSRTLLYIQYPYRRLIEMPLAPVASPNTDLIINEGISRAQRPLVRHIHVVRPVIIVPIYAVFPLYVHV